jgi:hypothetical protein
MFVHTFYSLQIKDREDSKVMRTVPLAEIERDVTPLSEPEFLKKYDFSKDDLRVFLDTLVRNLTVGHPWTGAEVQE